MSGRPVLAACLAILAACYTAAVLAPARLLAVIEIPLLVLLATVTVAAWLRRARHRKRTRPDHERHRP